MSHYLTNTNIFFFSNGSYFIMKWKKTHNGLPKGVWYWSWSALHIDISLAGSLSALEGDTGIAEYKSSCIQYNCASYFERLPNVEKMKTFPIINLCKKSVFIPVNFSGWKMKLSWIFSFSSISIALLKQCFFFFLIFIKNRPNVMENITWNRL